MRVRLARVADAAAIASIYNQGIEDRIGTFETELRTEAMISSWFDDIHPIVVVEHDGEIIAYASTSSYRERACYAGIAEFSVYVRRDWRGKGAGRLALSHLMHESEVTGFWKLVSRIFVENDASRRLMQRLCFREVGIYEKHGQLDGVWRDVVIVEYLFVANLLREPRAQIGKAQPEDLPQILALLERGNLPTQGVADVRETTIVARKESKVIGCAALEIYGHVALLRSVAVDPAHRGQELSRALVQHQIRDAQHLDVHRIYLLTETASDYFPRFGFRLIDRSDVPPAIQRSVEWTSACPMSAQVMVLHLDAT
jgi:phosphinothricin acetyltransferase